MAASRTMEPLNASPHDTVNGRDDMELRLLRDFQLEASENLDEAEQALLAIDQNSGDRKAREELCRRIHSIKGTASYVGLHAISDLAHALEAILETTKHQAGFSMPGSLLDACFETVDALRRMVDQPEDHQPPQSVLRRLEEERTALGLTSGATAPAPLAAVDPTSIFIDSAGQHVESMRVCLERMNTGQGEDKTTLDMFFRAAHSLKSSACYMGFEDIEVNAERIENVLCALRQGEIVCSEPLLNVLAEHLAGVTLHFGQVVRESGENSKQNTVMSPVGSDFAAPNSTTSSFAVAGASMPDGGGPTPGRTMRIDQNLLDGFMNLVGELIVARNVLGHVQKRLDREADASLPGLRELRGACQLVSRISDAMQRNIMALRMVPVKTVFQKLPRIIRDVTQKNGKKIDLVLHGEETEIDKGIAEEISDPLVHIIRNAADHGIELPDLRRERGKPERGTVAIKAGQEGNSFVIEILDDGAGIDTDLVLEKALERGLIQPDQADRISREEIIQLIFAPGFSTAREVSSISGRGVGMDVVLTNIRKVKGAVKIDSQQGQGTRIRLELPLTLAVVETLLVGVGRETFAIPVEAVRETVKLKRSAIKSMMKRRAMTLRGEVIGLETLAEILGINGDHGLTRMVDAARDEDDDIPVLILQNGNELLGVAVDKLQRQEEIVIKPLVGYLADLPGLAGASILGDGRALLVLDPLELMQAASGGARP